MNQRLKARRKMEGLTQKQIAEKTGISERVYQRYEAGKAEPRAGNAIKIAKILKCQVEDIF